uniref:Nucleoside diphosphate kinase-like domain-containing protein n=1 Tax=Naja naja TaxID=35670 RepID=A0A8C6YIK7_NAJNA
MRLSWPGLRRALQLTLAIVKPDAVAHPLVLEAVHETILNHKFLIVRMKDLLWTKEDSQRFYQEHSGWCGGFPMQLGLKSHLLGKTGEGSLVLQPSLGIF